ncbi:T9SS type A sorting domain-containing protein [Aquiflexum gelatinilyticum]|uniref:T9SS type A sorting domain-containing protein n=1 Tax=Aquiflexum gelatinilyticum TaxID=2961943 RepID=UPI002169DF75|nr:T9SS type A sorting domain-containing protein [Aquiflexum gelatinilyticum]MCS4435038.1 T9SS type A sorting domain-containing protein [Aquiflexum gelatinilyticum]
MQPDSNISFFNSVPAAKICCLVLLAFMPLISWGQTTYTWIGVDNGAWTNRFNWSPTRTTPAATDILQFNSGETLTITAVPSQTIRGLIVTNNSNITLASTVSNQNFNINNGTGVDWIVDSGATLTIRGTSRLRITLAASASAVIDGELVLGTNGNINTANAGTLVTVNGKITNTGGSFTSSATAKIVFGPNSEYNHARNGTALPFATWNPTSTTRMTGITGTTVGSTNQNFGNVIFQSPAQTVNMSFLPLSIAGDLIIDNGTSTGQIRQTTNAFTVNGNFLFINGRYAIGNGTSSNRSITVLGNATVEAGILSMSISSNAVGTLNIAGDFTHSGGTITETSSGSGRIIFNGDSSNPQTYTSGGTVTNVINYIVSTGAFVQSADSNTSFLGGGTFTLQTGATLGIKSPQGIATTGATGLVRVTGARSYNTGADYIYNGNSNQSTGNGLPATVNNLTIDNEGTLGNQNVTIFQNTSITSNLSVFQGGLDLGIFSASRGAVGGVLTVADGAYLGIGGSNSLPENFSSHAIGCNSTIEYYGTDQTVANINSPSAYGKLLLSGTGIKSFQVGTNTICSDFEILGTPTATAAEGITFNGNVQIGLGATFLGGGFTHQVAGNWNVEGVFVPENGQVVFDENATVNISGGVFNNLTLSGPGLKTINGNIEINGYFLVEGLVDISSPSTVTVRPSAQMVIESSSNLTTTGTAKIVLNPAAVYLNLSAQNPRLEVQQELTGDKGWRMMGSPVGTTYADILANAETQGFPGANNPDLQPNILWVDETDPGTSLQTWRKPAQITDAVVSGRGHYLYVFNGAEKPAGGGNYSDGLPLTLSGTGTEPNLTTGTFDFGVTFTSRDTSLIVDGGQLTEVNVADAGFNLIANPTASMIDFYAPTGWNKTNIDNTIYVWDPTSGSFLTHNGTLGTLGNGRIAPYQAFWIRTNGANPQLQLTGNDVKTIVSKEFFGRKTEEEPFAIQLAVTGEEMQAESFISFGREGKESNDPKDAYQLESLADDWLFLYTYGSLRTSNPLVINSLPMLDEREMIIPVHLAASKNGKSFQGSFLMNWSLPNEWPADKSIILMDHLNKKAINMQEESAYTFSFQAPEVPKKRARLSSNEFELPNAIVFKSPYKTGESNAKINSTSPERPFTIYIGGAFQEDKIEYLPDFPKLFPVSPNPFMDSAKIRFFLPESTKAEILIYDLMGQKVGGFPAAEYGTGIHELEWMPNSTKLSTGMYVVQLATENYRFTQKLIKN